MIMVQRSHIVCSVNLASYSLFRLMGSENSSLLLPTTLPDLREKCAWSIPPSPTKTLKSDPGINGSLGSIPLFFLSSHGFRVLIVNFARASLDLHITPQILLFYLVKLAPRDDLPNVVTRPFFSLLLLESLTMTHRVLYPNFFRDLTSMFRTLSNRLF